VPVDPHTPGIFDGEEFNRAARFFTYGYDIYTPNRVCKSYMLYLIICGIYSVSNHLIWYY
jgi:hypothetical protein